MAKVTYVESNGTSHTLEVADGVPLMRGAKDNDVPGILAECGGCCACATCQVLVDPEWQARLPPPGPMEQSMLEEALEPDGRQRRLSCQLPSGPELEGLILHIPESQY